jgi:hypothetical protein
MEGGEFERVAVYEQKYAKGTHTIGFALEYRATCAVA